VVALSARAAAAGAAVLSACLLLAGCEPSCRDACRHVLEGCGVERPQYSVEDCRLQCEAFLQHYEDDWQKADSRAAVRCVAAAPCEDLRSGTPCYDAAVFVW